MDVVKAIRRLKSNLRTYIKFYHLYGHQDTSQASHMLSREVQINVEVDPMAKEAL